jgi:Predicted signal transduction protein with a C-terminal ATPase domain
MIVGSIRKSIFAKLLLPYILLFVVAFTLVGYFMTLRFYSTILGRNEEYARSTLLQINYNLESSIKEIDEKIKNLYTTEYFSYNLAQLLRDLDNSSQDSLMNESIIDRQLAYLKNSNPNIVGVVLYTNDSKVVYSTSYPGIRTSYNFEAYKYLQSIKKNNYGLFISPVYNPDYYIKFQGQVVTLARNIIDIDYNKSRAVLLVDVGVNIFRDIFKQYRNELKGDVIFLDGDGNAYFNLKETMTGKKPDFPEEAYTVIEKTGDGSVHQEKVLIGKDHYYLYILKSALTGCKIIYLISEKDLFLGAGSIKSDILLIVVISLLLASAVLIAVSKIFTNRIRKMARIMESIGKGELDTRVDESSGDELGQLASCINNMCERLKNFIEKSYINELKDREHEIREKRAELRALQMQINPHFLFNTLEAIKINALIGEKADTAEMIRILAGIFRWNVKNDESMVTLEEELIYAMSYLELQQIRLKDRLQIIYEIDDEVKPVRVIKLILQPVIENAIAYGIEGTTGKGTITLSVARENDLVIIHVKDSGPGMDSDKLEGIRNGIYGSMGNESSYKIGLRNVNERIRMYFGEHYGLEIYSMAGKGTDVKLTLPWRVE